MDYKRILNEIVPVMEQRFMSSYEIREKYNLSWQAQNTLIYQLRRKYELETFIEKRGRIYTHYKITSKREIRPSAKLAGTTPFHELPKVIEKTALVDWYIEKGASKTITNQELYKLVAMHGVKVYAITDYGKKYLN